MIAVIATVAAGLMIAGIVYDTARMIGPDESRCPPLARLWGRRAALEAAESRLVAVRLRGRIDTAAYQRRMAAIAHGHRYAASPPRTHVGGGHG
ncbi:MULTISPECIES: hypothetical protein [Streptomyces]|uniref:hypothetical protein n=1 Tax=Streptomyces TaxID=1883 RepID=UPI001009D306|nr:hypothetical protein [Streptomyces roseicoloratus]